MISVVCFLYVFGYNHSHFAPGLHTPFKQYEVLCFSIDQACGCVCWSPSSSTDSACVAAGYSDGTLRIFQLASSEMEMKLHPHHVTVTAIQYSANGERHQKHARTMSMYCLLGRCYFMIKCLYICGLLHFCLSLPCFCLLLPAMPHFKKKIQMCLDHCVYRTV